MRVRGHTLLWTRLNGPPEWLAGFLATEDAQALRARALAHVADVVGRYRGRIAQWDVFNEPLAMRGGDLDPENVFLAEFGEAFIVDAFKAARAADPAAQLYLNEIGLETDDRRFEAFAALLERLLAAGAPIDGVGLQGHVFNQAPTEDALRRRFDRLAALGLDVEITELDVARRAVPDAPDPDAAQAAIYARIVRACRQAARCRGVTVWGLHDGASWLGAENAPLLFDAALQPKPALRAVFEALASPER
jgi:endo-1,4-beta-xylanase